MIKRIISILSVLSILLVLPTPVLAAESKNVPTRPSIEEILENYHSRIHEAKTQESKIENNTRSTHISTYDEITEDTVKTLNEAGYEAYNINSENYSAVEDALCTDLSAIGLNRDSSYIIVVSGESQNVARTYYDDDISGTPSDAFYYTFNGTRYYMRYLTVTAADNPAYVQISDANLLNSKSENLLINCLDTAIDAYFSYYIKPFGTVASILGLSISDFKPGATAMLELRGSTNWTRAYTQIYNVNTGFWQFGSCTEYATMLTNIISTYYKPGENHCRTEMSPNKYCHLEAPTYFDFAWRKERAIYGYLNSIIQYDLTGPVKYYYGDECKITHYEHFV